VLVLRIDASHRRGRLCTSCAASRSGAQVDVDVISVGKKLPRDKRPRARARKRGFRVNVLRRVYPGLPGRVRGSSMATGISTLEAWLHLGLTSVKCSLIGGQIKEEARARLSGKLSQGPITARSPWPGSSNALSPPRNPLAPVQRPLSPVSFCSIFGRACWTTAAGARYHSFVFSFPGLSLAIPFLIVPATELQGRRMRRLPPPLFSTPYPPPLLSTPVHGIAEVAIVAQPEGRIAASCSQATAASHAQLKQRAFRAAPLPSPTCGTVDHASTALFSPHALNSLRRASSHSHSPDSIAHGRGSPSPIASTSTATDTPGRKRIVGLCCTNGLCGTYGHGGTVGLLRPETCRTDQRLVCESWGAEGRYVTCHLASRCSATEIMVSAAS
jgi:hypothetical protein